MGDFKFLIFIITVVLFLSSIVGGAAQVSSYSCYNSWKDSGMSTRYSFFTGCLLEVESGKWIPSVAYRVNNK